MAESNGIKRRLLSEAVQENLATMLPGEARHEPVAFPSCTVALSRQCRWQKSYRVMVLSLLLIALSAYTTSTIPADPALPTPTRHDLLQPVLLEALGGPPHTTLFAAPTPLDLKVLPLTVRKIALDPGHGGKDSGAHTFGGLLEKDLTLDIALRLRPLLEEADFQVVMTRESDETVSLAERSTLANTQEADLFVSIHINAIANRHIRGLETYYLGPTDDVSALELAAHENQASGYSLADFRRLLDGIHLHVKREESRRFAEATHTALLKSLQAVNPSLSNRGVKTAPFVVLTTTTMPAILAEVSCLSNENEARLLATGLYRQEIAQALARGIRAYTAALQRSVKKGT